MWFRPVPSLLKRSPAVSATMQMARRLSENKLSSKRWINMTMTRMINVLLQWLCVSGNGSRVALCTPDFPGTGPHEPVSPPSTLRERGAQPPVFCPLIPPQIFYATKSHYVALSAAEDLDRSKEREYVITQNRGSPPVYQPQVRRKLAWLPCTVACIVILFSCLKYLIVRTHSLHYLHGEAQSCRRNLHFPTWTYRIQTYGG